jgi:hypothetical protein
VLRIFITIKIPSLSTGFEPAKHVPNSKNANNYTTEDYQSSLGIRGFDFSVQPLQLPTTFSGNSYGEAKVTATSKLLCQKLHSCEPRLETRKPV